LADLLTDSGIIISSSSTSTGDGAYTTSDISTKFGDFKTFEKYVRGYFKGLNISPTTEVLTVWKNTKIYLDDLKKYVDNKTFVYSDVLAGEFLPTSSMDKKYFAQSKIPSFYQQPIAPMTDSTVAGKNPPNSGKPVVGGIGVVAQGGVGGLSTNFFEGGLFKGIIRDFDGDPIPVVQVTLSSLESYFSDRTIQTNSDGVFDFGDASKVPGEVKLRMLKTGYATKELEITTTTDARALLTEEGSSADPEKIIGITMLKNS
jgi:hypothetical protein